MLWLAALLSWAYLMSIIVQFWREDPCMNAGGRRIAAQAHCEF
jgi:hypothetical protein